MVAMPIGVQSGRRLTVLTNLRDERVRHGDFIVRGSVP